MSEHEWLDITTYEDLGHHRRAFMCARCKQTKTEPVPNCDNDSAE